MERCDKEYLKTKKKKKGFIVTKASQCHLSYKIIFLMNMSHLHISINLYLIYVPLKNLDSRCRLYKGEIQEAVFVVSQWCSTTSNVQKSV